MKIAKNLTDLIGKTPLINLQSYSKHSNAQANLYAKLEYFNPTGSVKDRPAVYMIKSAEENGILKPNSTIIEPTSGNFGISLAAIAVPMGYKVVIIMPENMSSERIDILKALGANVILSPANEGMKGAIHKANELKNSIEDAVILDQFSNPYNPLAHSDTTAAEILNDLHDKVDIFVSGVGTGGTLTGTSLILKSVNSTTKVIAVEPKDSPFLSKGVAGKHKIQGIGAGFLPKTCDINLIDSIIDVATDEAFLACRLLAKTEGLLIGISSGAALFAATKLAVLDENKNKNIVTIFPDSAQKYLSTELFKDI